MKIEMTGQFTREILLGLLANIQSSSSCVNGFLPFLIQTGADWIVLCATAGFDRRGKLIRKGWYK